MDSLFLRMVRFLELVTLTMETNVSIKEFGVADGDFCTRLAFGDYLYTYAAITGSIMLALCKRLVFYSISLIIDMVSTIEIL